MLCIRLNFLNLSTYFSIGGHNIVSEIPYKIHPHALPRTLKQLNLSANFIISLESLCRIDLKNLQLLSISNNLLSTSRPFIRINCTGLKFVQATGNLQIDPGNWTFVLSSQPSTINIADSSSSNADDLWFLLGTIRGPRARFKESNVKIT